MLFFNTEIINFKLTPVGGTRNLKFFKAEQEKQLKKVSKHEFSEKQKYN